MFANLFSGNVPVEEGEELILQIEETDKKAALKRSWQTAMKDEDKVAAKAVYKVAGAVS